MTWQKLDKVYLDSSRNFIDDSEFADLQSSFEANGVYTELDRLFAGENVNFSDGLPALHYKLREKDKSPEVLLELEKCKNLAQKLHSGELLGVSGKSIKYIVNIGLGGSYLGVKLLCDSLKEYAIDPSIKNYFIANVDFTDISRILSEVELDRTLFIVASKSFTTAELLLNLNTIKNIMTGICANTEDLAKHFIFITANTKKIAELDIPSLEILKIWDNIGGRFSIWSAMSLMAILTIGYDNFLEFLEGAQIVDKEMRQSPKTSIPAKIAMMSYYYKQKSSCYNNCVVAYSSALAGLSGYLQQLDMESNGKNIDKSGNLVDAGYLLWGGSGTNDQHSYFQYLYQANFTGSIDFVISIKNNGNLHHHKELFSNCLGQAEALFEGNGLSNTENAIKGKRVVNIFLLESLTPYTLGTLLAIYEYKVILLGFMWKINSFNQPAVAFGKQVANRFLNLLDKSEKNDNTRVSEAINLFLKHND